MFPLIGTGRRELTRGSTQYKEGTEEYEAAIINFLTKHNQYTSSPSDLPPRLSTWAIMYLRHLNHGNMIDPGDATICPPRAIRAFSNNDHWDGSYKCDEQGIPLPPRNGDQRKPDLDKMLAERKRTFEGIENPDR